MASGKKSIPLNTGVTIDTSEVKKSSFGIGLQSQDLNQRGGRGKGSEGSVRRSRRGQFPELLAGETASPASLSYSMSDDFTEKPRGFFEGPRQMKIAVIDPSGFSLPYDSQLCNAMGRQGHKVELLTRPLRSNEAIKATNFALRDFFYTWSENSPLKGKKHLFRYGKGLEHIWDMFRLYRFLNRFKPDVIHFQWSSIPLLDRFFVKRMRSLAPVVLTAHDVNYLHGAPSSRLQVVGWKEFLRVFDGVIVLSQNAEEGLRSSNRLVEKIPHGLLELMRPDETRGKELGKPAVLFFGNVKPYKGVDVLLKAWSTLNPENRSQWQLIIAGRSGEYGQSLRQLSESLDIAQEVQWIDRFLSEEEASHLIDMSQILVFPYKEINASGALKAVLPFGKPILASRLGVFSEMMAHEDSVLFFEPENIGDCAHQLARLCEDSNLRGELGQGARRLAGEVPSWQDISHQTIEFYERVSRERGGRERF